MAYARRSGALVRRRTRDVRRSPEVSFTIEPGEIVGFLGPNGAGKTTTLKMLAGLLHPTTGTADVLGFTPWRRDRDYLGRMSLIMGQRNQLHWDIPVLDSYRLNQAIFRIPAEDFRTRLDELVELLDLADLLRKPVRNLSLGERMKCEIAGSLLHCAGGAVPGRADHRPGRGDAAPDPLVHRGVQRPHRGLRDADQPLHGRRRGAVPAGDRDPPGPAALRRRPDRAGAAVRGAQDDHRGAGGGGHGRRIRCRPGWSNGAEVERTATGFSVRVPKADTPAVAGRLLAALPVADLTIEEPPIDQVIEQVFAARRALAGEPDD